MDISKYTGQQGVCEVQNKERFIAKVIDYSFDGTTHHFSFKSPLPVRELNNGGWTIGFGHTVFGQDFDFSTSNVKIEGDAIEFIEVRRELTVKLNFEKKAVGEKTLAYINKLTGV
ncbi:hypothetical protein [Flavobacterium sp.]|uniref:hypothetical protein n=1 Tax=Flavobacterium sp. TaxID=239 RepID=UPI0011F7B7BF|nr:hypothetical protein [Flavobacterium sp.]RZJ70759.1 MAG: hypothetical protein EOO49_12970 [Flavobacterium sp.]